ncbi:MAG: hypothetical protein M1827_006682 [Pycnora praestabilis]|nr:MAG: hypothetical protein M1827_006682 [Pycnora praestabilis]
MAEVLPAHCATAFLGSGCLSVNDRKACEDSARKLFPQGQITPVSRQGGCSYTLMLEDRRIIQFRPLQYRLDLTITDAAKRVFGSYAPETTSGGIVPSHGFLIYLMEYIPGDSYIHYQPRTGIITDGQMWAQHLRLCEDLADFLACSWHNSSRIQGTLHKGKVGMSYPFKMKKLGTELPQRFQTRANFVLKNLDMLDALPLVLNHGDMLPSNIVVNPCTGRLNGLVDWAEAEFLPFGMCLYGLEELLGFMTPRGWIYYHGSMQLREAFWRRLCTAIPVLKANQELLQGIAIARDLGVLLFHGYAWDEGAIDRVVNESIDSEEIRYLEAFLEQPPLGGLFEHSVNTS